MWREAALGVHARVSVLGVAGAAPITLSHHVRPWAYYLDKTHLVELVAE
jgi:hypothetical protein